MAFCSHCGRELADGANFCFTCGCSVGEPSEATGKAVYIGQVHKCPRCGEVLNAYEVCCSSCGYEIRDGGVSASVQKFAEQLKTATTEYQKATIIQGFPIPNNREDIFEFLILASSSLDKHLNKAVLAAWVSKIEQSYKKAQLVLRQEQDLDHVEQIYADAQDKLQELTHERIQSKKMPSLPKEEKKTSHPWTRYFVGLAVGLAIWVVIMAMVMGQDSPDGTEGDDPETGAASSFSEQSGEAGGSLLEQGKEYTYGIDKSDLYVVTAVSDSVIKIEKWSRGLFLQSDYSLKYDLGAYEVSDPTLGFQWLNEEQSVFRITLKDQREFSGRRGQEVVFAESWMDGDQYKGSHCLDEVLCYRYQHDDSHLYKAVIVSEGLMKIECWYRQLGIGEFRYGYDVCIIEIDDPKTDLRWSDEEQSSFTVNLQDRHNNSLKELTFIVFEKEA